jgi:hypothetical protein
VLFRKAGYKPVYLPGVPWGDGFMRAYAAAQESSKIAPIVGAVSGIKRGSLDEVIESYYRLVFPTLAESTRAMRRGVPERFRNARGRSGQRYGDKSVAGLDHEAIASIIAAKAATPHAANSLRKILRHMLEHAIAIRMIKFNPAIGTKRLKTASGGHHSWTDLEIERYRAHWPLGTQQRLAMELALETTSRRADITRVGPQHRRGDVLDLRHTKNDSEAFIPLTDALRAAIEAMGPNKHLTYLHTQKGAPRSAKALGGDFRSWCDAAGLPKHCSLHGLRKGGARRLAEAGASAKEIMSITGHKTLAEVQRYVDAADKTQLARQAYEKLRNKREADGRG